MQTSVFHVFMEVYYQLDIYHMKLRQLLLSPLFTVAFYTGSAQTTNTILKSGHIDSAQIFELRYVPVEVPAGTTEIRVKLQYSDQGKNVLNMGVYAPGDYSPGVTTNFRGWSGGAKNDFFINTSNASTGYVPGIIKQGKWHVIIYPSTMIAKGLNWTMEITLLKSQQAMPFKIKPANDSINAVAGWYSGDLHMHTLHSDGRRTQLELVEEAVDKKLDYIISTEHNTNSANLTWGNYDQKNLLIINGEEITSTTFGHWNALGLKTNTIIDWRYAPDNQLIKKYVDMVHRDGGLCIINHPFYIKDLSNSFKYDPLLFDGIEIWNGNWDFMDAKALNWWNSLLQQGYPMLAIGASDTHKATGSENNLGVPATVVYAQGLNKKSILSGLKSRKAYLSAFGNIGLTFSANTQTSQAIIGETLHVKPKEDITATLAFKLLPGATIHLIGEHGTISTEKGSKQRFKWPIPTGSTKYIRVEIRDAKGQMLALTNPIWLK
jgi:hypothetical protein